MGYITVASELSINICSYNRYETIKIAKKGVFVACRGIFDHKGINVSIGAAKSHYDVSSLDLSGIISRFWQQK